MKGSNYEEAKKVVRVKFSTNGNRLWDIFTDGKWRRKSVCAVGEVLNEFGLTVCEFYEKHANETAMVEVNADDYAITTEAQDTAIEAETELAKAGDTDTDNFDTQVADALKARNVAKANLDEKDAIVAKAKAEMRQACDVYEATKANILKLYERKAAELTAKIKVPERFMDVIKQNGTDDFIRKELFVYAHEIYNWDKHVDEYFFAIGKYNMREANRLAIYETPKQVETVIRNLKAAIERGDEKFTFPTVEEMRERYNPRIILDRTADGQYTYNADTTTFPMRFWYSDAQGNEISPEEARELELEFINGCDKDDEDFLDEDDRWFNEGDRRYDEMRDMWLEEARRKEAV